jgi:hypothetical protein
MKEEAIAKYSSAELFKIWDYHVSHQHLLLRSPHTRERKEDIDVVFSNVGYLELPSHFHGILLSTPPDTETLAGIKRRAGQEFSRESRLFTLESGGREFYVVAGGAIVHVHNAHGPICFDAPLLRHIRGDDDYWGHVVEAYVIG